MPYIQTDIAAEFRECAAQADKCLHANDQAEPETMAAYRHDECLGERFVYDFLTAQPYLRNRATLVSELQWIRDADVPAPANAISARRFQDSRFCVAKGLLRRFQFASDPVAPVAA